jgi:cytoskeletal protein RodZ
VIVFLAAVLGFVAGLFWNMYRSSSDEYADEEDSDDSVDEPSENSDAETQASPSEASEPEVSAATPDSDDEDDVLTPGEEEARKDSFDS